MITPVIIWAPGIVTKGFKKNLETIPGKHSIDTLQKTAAWNITYNMESTKHSIDSLQKRALLIREVLQSETWSLSGVVFIIYYYYYFILFYFAVSITLCITRTQLPRCMRAGCTGHMWNARRRVLITYLVSKSEPICESSVMARTYILKLRAQFASHCAGKHSRWKLQWSFKTLGFCQIRVWITTKTENSWMTSSTVLRLRTQLDRGPPSSTTEIALTRITDMWQALEFRHNCTSNEHFADWGCNIFIFTPHPQDIILSAN
jgi:hypothetical protein